MMKNNIMSFVNTINQQEKFVQKIYNKDIKTNGDDDFAVYMYL